MEVAVTLRGGGWGGDEVWMPGEGGRRLQDALEALRPAVRRPLALHRRRSRGCRRGVRPPAMALLLQTPGVLEDPRFVLGARTVSPKAQPRAMGCQTPPGAPSLNDQVGTGAERLPVLRNGISNPRFRPRATRGGAPHAGVGRPGSRLAGPARAARQRLVLREVLAEVIAEAWRL